MAFLITASRREQRIRIKLNAAKYAEGLDCRLELVIDMIRQDKTHNKIKISTNPENMVARKLYAKPGFYDTGELHDDEVLMILEY